MYSEDFETGRAPCFVLFFSFKMLHIKYVYNNFCLCQFHKIKVFQCFPVNSFWLKIILKCII